MFINIIKSYRYVVAVADKELIGKIFEEGNMQLNVKENFYKGEEMTPEKAIELLQDMKMEDATFNIVGRKSIDIALKAGIITEEQIGEIQGVPFALVLI